MKKNIHIYSVALIIAVILWLYLSLNSSFNYSIEVPLRLQMSDEQSTGNNVPDTLTIALNGNGWDLLSVVLNPDLEYRYDISNFKRDAKIVTMQQANERIGIPFSIRINSIDPDTVYVSYGNVSSKYVPVINNIEIEPRIGYDIVGRPSISPDSVKVSGPAAEIRKINSVQTESKLISDVNSDLLVNAKLENKFSASVKLETTDVSISYQIELSAEKTFNDLTIKIDNLPPENEVLLIPPTISVTLRGGVDELSGIDASEINVHLSFEEIYADTLGFVIPKIDTPPNIELLGIVPDRFQYIIKNK
ncbi:MAG: hypothetical protein OZ913_02835 [Ignavibacteriaceae bacterium]|nr:MAG: YbbR-like domain-containing protein [Chlorobiota bacterium]MBW7856129.1 YbbR-like domain-containing protein [Ignavibacteria bacterium]MCC6885807.1 YbbR-like domain-containing protein [Ignavibacteriales bacterium]MCE7952998.1 YbbR-like domain-containing protein [Chlorobi bacterium CHB7]MDL1887164.1 hypothetical protein [Ignavibacteria bacterium CHB1]MEB2329219.1 hypothetical protein [Ignavibacteriaceae bacterium]OQY78057.1 MAG: hypothetical protein B6D43_05965 [Ignavibacteriales bacter